ncbi:hypothetical protein Hanom_Chr10g00888431 [Helianthus anomalus]
MKPQHLSVDTTTIHKCERVAGKRLRQLFQATMAIVDDNKTENTNPNTRVSYIEAVRKVNQRVNTDDPIRTIMFLGSWCHT